MGLKLEENPGYPLEKQIRSWREVVPEPISKLDSDAFSRIRIILMNGIELEAIRFSHACSRMNRDLQRNLAAIRRVEQQQATTINWLLPADQSPLETTIGYEQVAIEVTAAVAQQEPNAYLAQAYRFGLLEDFDHLYRYSALMDRLEGKDANNILQCYTDILPGRPTMVEHRHPFDDLRTPYDRKNAEPISKLNALMIMSSEFQTHDYYMNVGPLFADPLARAPAVARRLRTAGAAKRLGADQACRLPDRPPQRTLPCRAGEDGRRIAPGGTAGASRSRGRFETAPSSLRPRDDCIDR